jgi:hypothetical protein
VMERATERAAQHRVDVPGVGAASVHAAEGGGG